MITIYIIDKISFVVFMENEGIWKIISNFIYKCVLSLT